MVTLDRIRLTGLLRKEPRQRGSSIFDRGRPAQSEIVEARIWAGLHFRTADVQAVELGTKVANFASANYFEPVGNH